MSCKLRAASAFSATSVFFVPCQHKPPPPKKKSIVKEIRISLHNIETLALGKSRLPRAIDFFLLFAFSIVLCNGGQPMAVAYGSGGLLAQSEMWQRCEFEVFL